MGNESETVSLQAETVYNSTGTDANWSAFLEMEGAYTTEVFEFSTVIDNPANPQLVIGAHMAQPNAGWTSGTGIRLQFADYGLALYGHNSNNWPAYAKSWKNVFTNTDPYDFVVQVQTDAEGYMTILLDIKQNGNTVWSFNSATSINGQGVALGKVKVDTKGNAINTSGAFVVWSWNEYQTITFKKPYELTAE